MSKKWNKEKIIKKLKETAEEIGRSPTNKELRKINSALARVCRKYFGSFNKAKKKAGLEIYRRGGGYNIRPTRPEQRMIDICKKYNLPFKYVGDGSFWIKDLNPDFINCNGKKQVIEVFGDYWHKGREDIDWKQTEFGRKAYLSQLEYDCLILWEHELVGNSSDNKLSEEKIVKKIKNEM